MNVAKALLGLPERPDLPPVDGFRYRQRIAVVEGSPAQAKQLAWTKRPGDVQHEQDAIPPAGQIQNRPQLLPGKHPLVLGPKILWNLQLPGRISHQEFLLDGFVEDGL